MSLEQLIVNLITQYGYLVVALWTFVEGETIVVLAGMAAASGIGDLELSWVILSAIAGSFFGDQLYYYLGRRWGPKIIARRKSWQESAEVVYTHLRRHQYWLILTFRFYYGLRNVTPFAIGAAHIPRLRFFLLNLVGAVVWATVFACGGKLLGETFKLIIDDYHRYALYVLGICVLVGFAVWPTILIRRRIRAKRQ